MANEVNVQELKHGYFLEGTNEFLVICVHGFGGSPVEHYLTAQAFNRAGYHVSVPALKGHGTSLEELDHCRYADWIASLEADYQKHKSAYRGVFFCGLSMGGLLSLYMAEKHPEIRALSVMAPAVIYHDKSVYLAPLLLPFKKHLPFPDAFPNLPSENRIYLSGGYEATSVHAAIEMNHLQRRVRSALKAIHQPLIIFQSKADLSVNPKTEDYVLSHISSTQKEGVMYERGSHVLPLDVDRDDIFAKSCAFFGRFLHD